MAVERKVPRKSAGERGRRGIRDKVQRVGNSKRNRKRGKTKKYVGPSDKRKGKSSLPKEHRKRKFSITMNPQKEKRTVPSGSKKKRKRLKRGGGLSGE